MKLVLLLAAVSLVACGGKLDDGDGGTPSNDASTGGDSPIIFKDASTKPDVIVTPPPGQCGNFQLEGSISSDGSCETSGTWQCGTTSYAVKCSCPDATCECSQQTGSSGSGTTVNAPSVCGSCTPTVADLGTACGFPTN